MLDRPAKVIYETLNNLGVGVFPFLAFLCIALLILIRDDIKNWEKTRNIDKISVALLFIGAIFFGVLSIITP